jgi:hypothetical protein
VNPFKALKYFYATSEVNPLRLKKIANLKIKWSLG